MDKFKRSQILKLLFIIAFLIITPLLSTSLRPTYLYFILNLLIISLGAEAGLLSFISKAADDKKVDKKPSAIVTGARKPLISSETASSDKDNEANYIANQIDEFDDSDDHVKVKAKRVFEKCSSEKITVAVKLNNLIKKCPSTPSIFFIEDNDIDDDVDDDDDQDVDKDVGEISGQELFNKAETFIGNFYKQLKMQREDSWKKLNELCQKAF